MLYREFASQQEIDEQYDPMLKLNPPEVLAGFKQKSDATLAALGTPETVSFGATLAEHLEIFRADRKDGEQSTEQAKAPLHIFIHGGYWRACSSKDFALVARQLVPAGITTLVINYALCPTVSMTEIARQSRAAVAWAWHNADQLGIDRNRITVSGHSAGGHLTGMLLATRWQADYGLPDDIIKGAVAISGLFDLAPFPHSWLQPALQLTEREVRELSPLNLQYRTPVPVRLRVGEQESAEFHRQSTAFLDHLAAAGYEVEYSGVPDTDHYSVLDHFYNANGLFLNDVLELSGLKS